MRIELLVGAGRVRISVMDAGTEMSEPRVPRSCPDPDNAKASRGLHLVDQWVQRIGVHGDGRGRRTSLLRSLAHEMRSDEQRTVGEHEEERDRPLLCFGEQRVATGCGCVDDGIE